MSSPALSSGPAELAPTRQSLLERLRDLDDGASWQQFFDTYWKLIYCAAGKAGLSDSEAEEVVQETVIGVCRSIGEYRYEPQRCSFKGWLMHITRRRIIDRFRRRQTQPRWVTTLESDTSGSGMTLEVPDPAAEQAFEVMWGKEWEKNLVDAAMERVRRRARPEQYQIFYLHSVKNLPARQTARLLGTSTANVYVVAHRLAREVKREAQRLSEP